VSSDSGALKVGASPQHIESGLSKFLYRYKQRFPNVQVTLIEASGRETMAILERQEIRLGQNLAPIIDPNDQRFASLSLQHIDLLAACHPSLVLGKGRTIEINHLATHPLLLLDSSFECQSFRCCLLPGATQTEHFHERWRKPDTEFRASHRN
jgi:DNA-binding transcriptional LysR family regulator